MQITSTCTSPVFLQPLLSTKDTEYLVENFVLVVVFEQKDFPVNNPSSGWDGKFKGNRPQADVYIYQVEVFCENGDIIRFDGNLALIQ